VVRQIIAAIVTLTFLGACTDDTLEPSEATPESTITFGGTDATLAVDLADDPQERRKGLMGIEELPADQGMAFVWPGPVDSTFWMKDTLVPLSVAFVDESGYVIDVLDMQPCETDACPSYGIDEPFVLAIEANLGWFDEHGVGAGDRAELHKALDG
jgi:uncharacterized membrane protein (UPF0127 family)